jgi:lactoylglutathione lyase
MQLAQPVGQDGPIDMGTAMWKLYVWSHDTGELHEKAVAAGYTSTMEPFKAERWNTTIAFLADPDGYQVELATRHPD